MTTACNPHVQPYLDEAAAELRKARDANEKRAVIAAELASARHGGAEEVRREVADRNMEIGAAFERLAAIAAGLAPCCRHERPEPGQEQVT